MFRVIATLVLVGVTRGGAQVAPVGTTSQATSDVPVVVHLDRAPSSQAELELPLVTWSEMRVEPEPLAASFLRVDVQSPLLEVVTLLPPDPDGEGPAESVLTDPVELARRAGVVAAVNANGFSRLPGPDGKVPEGRWHAGEAVTIAGLAVSGGAVRSVSADKDGGRLALWVDDTKRLQIGSSGGETNHMREGCNGWWIDLVAEGRALPKPGGDRHPRTAAGLDATGRWLLLAVVDGRQPRHSVGMTAEELATLMVRHGCRRAINLDGGGSSVMMVAGTNGVLQVMNRPSDGKPRPLPILLGVRRKGRSL